MLGVKERPEEFTENVEGRKKTPILRVIGQARQCGQAILRIRDDDREYIYLEEHEKRVLVFEKEPLPPTLNDWYLEYRKRKYFKNKSIDPLEIVEVEGRHLDPQEGDYVLTCNGFGDDGKENIIQDSWPEVGVVQEINVQSYGDVSTIYYEIEVVTLKGEIETQFTSSNGIDDVVHSASGQHRRKSKGFFGSLFGKN
jgi:hypothetical protein